MEFYLGVLNDQLKLPEDNDAIGIIICKTKNKTVVEYALKSTTHPMGIATYTITTQLPPGYAELLPSIEAIQERLEGM